MPISMELYQQIRRLYLVEKLPKRQIARLLGIDRKTVTRYCDGEHIPDSKRVCPSYPAPKSKAAEPLILEYLEQNKESPRKQRLTSTQIWRHLRLDKGLDIGERTVRDVIRKLKNKHPDAFVPLQFEPGQVMEVDWGDAYAYIDGQKVAVSYFCGVLPYSYAIFVAVFPNKTFQSFCLGHIMAFEFFGGVPHRCIYDNLKTAVLSNSGKNAVKQEEFKRLEAHYAFEAVFCNVAAGWEKGGAENLVKLARRIALSPIPRAESFQQLQETVTSRCLEYCQTHKLRGRSLTIVESLNQERLYLLPIPLKPLEVSEVIEARVATDCTIRFKANRYSVPSNLVGMTVTVAANPFSINIYSQGKQVAFHKRTYQKNDPQYNPEHYLELLERKPRAIEDAAPIKQGQWPKELLEFKELYRGNALNIELVEILKLLRNYPRESLLHAVQMANKTGRPDIEMVRLYLGIKQVSSGSHKDPVSIDPVDISKYDKLMHKGGTTSEKCNSNKNR